MTGWSVLRRVRAWDWVVLAVTVGCLVYAVAGCASLKSAGDHAAQIGLGGGIGLGVGLAVGGLGLLAVAAAAVGASVATILSEPPCVTPGVVSSGPSPMQYVIWGGILYVLWIRRARILDAIRSRGDPSMMFKQLGHAFLGTARPGETR